MSFRVACLTGSRFIRNGKVYSIQGKNTLKNNISGCRYQTTFANAKFLRNGNVYKSGMASLLFGMAASKAQDDNILGQRPDIMFKETGKIIKMEPPKTVEVPKPEPTINVPQEGGKELKQESTTNVSQERSKPPKQISTTNVSQERGKEPKQKPTTNVSQAKGRQPA